MEKHIKPCYRCGSEDLTVFSPSLVRDQWMMLCVPCQLGHVFPDATSYDDVITAWNAECLAVYRLAEVEKIEDVLAAFSASMKSKMLKKLNQGFTGWDKPANASFLRSSLTEHVHKDRTTMKQMVDIANIAMMLWYINEETPLKLLDDWQEQWIRTFEDATGRAFLHRRFIESGDDFRRFAAMDVRHFREWAEEVLHTISYIPDPDHYAPLTIEPCMYCKSTRNLIISNNGGRVVVQCPCNPPTNSPIELANWNREHKK